MNIVKSFVTKSDCYKANKNKVDSRYTNFQKNGAKGLMLHSVGCNQPNANVFVKTWDKPNVDVTAHAVLQADGTVYQCLPWNYRGWHSGGSSNNTHIGVEITEPDCITYKPKSSTFTCSNVSKAQAQVKGTYNTAVELFAYLCKELNLNPLTDIISHKEGYSKGVASNHGDPEHLWKQLKLGYTMDTFRKAVKKAMEATDTKKETSNKTSTEMYRVRKSWADSKSQIGAYKTLKNAQAQADKNPGYYVFNSKGVIVYPVKTKSTYTGTLPKLTGKGYIAYGDYGINVQRLQKFLNWYGNYGLVVDGKFGAKTSYALEKFQKAEGLKVDGKFGSKSLAKAKAVKR